MGKQLQAKTVLRLLLRAVDQHITSVAGNTQWRQHVLQQFRLARNVDEVQKQRLLLVAQEYADLINNIAHHQELLNTYNIGVDPETRNRQMVEKTAARVGFQLPNAATQQDKANSIDDLPPGQPLDQPSCQQRQQQEDSNSRHPHSNHVATQQQQLQACAQHTAAALAAAKYGS